MGGGKSALIVSRACQTGKTDDIANGVNMGLGVRLVRVVGENGAAFICFETDIFQSHVVRVSRAAFCPEEDIADNLFVGFQEYAHVFVIGFNAVVFFVVANMHPVLAEVITEGVDDFVVEVGEQLAAAVDEIDFYLQAAEYGCVFATDDPRAVNGDDARCFCEVQDGVAVADPRMGKVNVGRLIGTRPRGDNKSPGGVAFRPSVEQRDFDGVLIDKRCAAQDDIDMIAFVIARAKVNLIPDEIGGSVEQFGQTRCGVCIGVDELLDVVAQRFARCCGSVRAVAAHTCEIVDDGNALAFFGGFHRRAFSARAGAYYDDVVVAGHRIVVSCQ